MCKETVLPALWKNLIHFLNMLFWKICSLFGKWFLTVCAHFVSMSRRKVDQSSIILEVLKSFLLSRQIIFFALFRIRGGTAGSADMLVLRAPEVLWRKGAPHHYKKCFSFSGKTFEIATNVILAQFKAFVAYCFDENFRMLC